MRSCFKSDLTDYCYSDPEAWEFESRTQAQEIGQRIREYHKDTLAEVKTENGQKKGISNPYPGRENGYMGL